MSTRRDLVQRAITIKIQLDVLAQYKADIIIISLNVICSRHDMAENIHLSLNN
jgi:hypothetical protein